MDEYLELLELKDELEYARDSFSIKEYKEQIDAIIDNLNQDIKEKEKTLLEEQRRERKERELEFERSVL